MLPSVRVALPARACARRQHVVIKIMTERGRNPWVKDYPPSARATRLLPSSPVTPLTLKV